MLTSGLCFMRIKFRALTVLYQQEKKLGLLVKDSFL